MRNGLTIGVCVLVVLGVARTSPARQVPESPVPTYRLEATDGETLTKRYSAEQVGLLEKLNRRDAEHLIRLDTLVVPDVWTDELTLAPIQREWVWAQSLPKAIVVDQPSQIFGGYEYGRLVRWGPVSTGRKETPTPAGSFNLTWRSRSRRSTDNDQWLLEWYFNFINARGVSFHQFDLPGVAASHACVRLLKRDAMWLYGWGQEWTLSANRREVLTTGTPVVIVGVYDFARPAPWLALDWWRTPVRLPDDPATGREGWRSRP